VTAFAILGALVALGAVAAVQEIRMRRWDPAFFRKGVLGMKETSPIPAAPTDLVTPPGLRARKLGPHEIAFVAPVLNGSLMRGLLRYRPELAALEVVGHLQWGMWCLLLVPALFGLWPLGLGVAVLLVYAYFGERRRFRATLDAAARHVA
jgi:hypothetical protein